MNKLKIAFIAIIAGVVSAILIPGSRTQNKQKPEPQPVVETININTNLLPHATNQIDRGNSTYYGTDWFKSNSNYIWDGWKIK